MTICVVTPARPGVASGNRMTALRWGRALRQLGHRVRLLEHYDDQPCDLLIALHARRSFASVERSRRLEPARPIVVALTGTDVYGDLDASPEIEQALAFAWRVVALQPLALERLAPRWRDKTRVLLQSATVPAGLGRRAADSFDVCVLANLRAVKDPLRAAAAARLLPASSRVRVLHAGAALEPELAAAARAEAARNPRYRWLGPLKRCDSLALLRSSRLMVLSSLMEGGANVISEAVAADLPVVVSSIPGSLGLLGADYPGRFPVGDTAALAELLARSETDAAFYQTLERWCARLKPLVDPAREREGWRQMLAELEPAAPARAGGRYRVVEAGARARHDLEREIELGLSRSPKSLPYRYFYDDQGSRLFEAICELPEYYLPVAEREILQARSGAIAASMPRGAILVELGSGNAAKTRLLIEALLGRQPSLRYMPIDISGGMLAASSRALLADYPALEILAISGEYEAGLAQLQRELEHAKLILWLGSNIGNFDRDEAAAFLQRVRRLMSPADRLLVGIDLRKERAVLERAYDDAQGVTAEFNRNLLRRINRELGGEFDADAFGHRAVYAEEAGRVEMYLVSPRRHRVRVGALGREFAFDAGEAIHTESSYKYSPPEIAALARAAGLAVCEQWFDAAKRFSLNLLGPAP